MRFQALKDTVSQIEVGLSERGEGLDTVLSELRKNEARFYHVVAAVEDYYDLSHFGAKQLVLAHPSWRKHSKLLRSTHPQLEEVFANAQSRRWLSEVERYVDGGGDVNVIDLESGFSLIFKAIEVRNPHVVRYLLDSGALVNQQSPEIDFFSPLHYALLAESDPEWCSLTSTGAPFEIAKILLDHGADLLIKDERLRTPMELAVELGIGERFRSVVEEFAP